MMRSAISSRCAGITAVADVTVSIPIRQVPSFAKTAVRPALATSTAYIGILTRRKAQFYRKSDSHEAGTIATPCGAGYAGLAMRSTDPLDDGALQFAFRIRHNGDAA